MSVDTHEEEERKKNNFIYYLSQQHGTLLKCCLYGVFLLVENTTYGCRQTEEFEFFVRGGAAVAVARCGGH